MNFENIYDEKDLIEAATELSKVTRGEKDFRMAVTVLEDLARGITVFKSHKGDKKVTIFGSARMEVNSSPYNMVKELASLLSDEGYLVITGGGPGLMEAGLRGASSGNRIGVTIDLPFEVPNLEKEQANGWPLARQSMFFTRKLAMVRNVQAFVAAPGGFGTLDEVFEVLTLMQTGKSKPAPLVLLEDENKPMWKDLDQIIRKNLINNKLIDEEDTNLYYVASTPGEAFEYIANFWKNYDGLHLEDDILSIKYKEELPTAAIEYLPQVRGFKGSTYINSEHKILSFSFEKKYWCDIIKLIRLINS